MIKKGSIELDKNGNITGLSSFVFNSLEVDPNLLIGNKIQSYVSGLNSSWNTISEGTLVSHPYEFVNQDNKYLINGLVMPIIGKNNNYPHQLSGGEQQRVSIARALLNEPDLILADEPTKGLDVSRRDDIIQLLMNSARDGGLLTITHDIEVARQIGGDIIVMKEGVVVEQGLAAQILDNPQHAYTQSLIAADPRHWEQREKSSIEKTPVLKVTNLSIGRHGKALSKDINFTIHTGEVVGVIGDSGCGKSTLGDTLLGLLTPVAGSVNKHIDGVKPYQWLKLFQDPPAAFTSSVTLGVLLEDLVKLHKLERQRIAPLMSKLKLDPVLLERKSTEVSGGELQRFAILRALLLDPVFLFADEPTSRLDPIIAKEVTDLLVDLAKEQGCALLLVSHDPHMIAKRCDTVVQL